MEEEASMHYRDEEIDLWTFLAILRKDWWKTVLISLAVGVVTLVAMSQYPNTYQSTAVITPAMDEKKPVPALGALASIGIDVGGAASKVEDLETLFNSNDLTVRVFKNHLLWPFLLGDRFDPATGKAKTSWADGFFGGSKERKAPGDWDAIRAAKGRLKVFVNKKAGTVSVSFESPSAEGSADIVKYYLEEGKSRLQEEALERAVKNKKFIEEQIGRTVDALTRDRLYSLYGQEMEQEMLARNREQFGFRVIDSPRVPDRKFRPHRAVTAVLAVVLSLFACSLFFVVRGVARGKNLLGGKPNGSS